MPSKLKTKNKVPLLNNIPSFNLNEQNTSNASASPFMNANNSRKISVNSAQNQNQ